MAACIFDMQFIFMWAGWEDSAHDTCIFLEAINTTKRLMSSLKCMSVEVINNTARLGSNHMEVNYINYK